MGSGLKTQFGLAKETTVGTAVTVTRFHEITGETLELDKNIIQGHGLPSTANRGPRASRRAYTTRQGKGDVMMDFPTVGGGLLLQAMTGSTPSATQQAATTAYIQRHVCGSTDGVAFTLQKGVADDSTTQPFTYRGGKCTGWKLSCAVGGILEVTTSWDMWEEVTSTALATFSPPSTAGVFNFTQGTLKLGGTASTTSGITTISGGTSVAAVTAAELTGANPTADSRFFFGSAGLKAEQLMNDNTVPRLTGSLSAEFTSRATFYDVFAADTQTSLELTFVGPTIASTYHYQLDIVVPAIFFDGETPKVGGPDIVAMSVPFTALGDALSNPAYEIDYQTTDTSV